MLITLNYLGGLYTSGIQQTDRFPNLHGRTSEYLFNIV